MDWASFYGLALFAAFYPLVIGVVALLLPRPRPAVLLAGMLTGGFLITVGSGIVIVSVLGSTNALGGSNKHVVRAAINIAIGVILLIATVYIWTGPHERKLLRRRHKQTADAAKEDTTEDAKKEKTGWAARAGKADSFWAAFLIGVAIDLPSVWYLAALKYIIDGNFAVAVSTLLIISYALIAYIFIEVPLIFNIRWPKQTQRVVQSANNWVKAHNRQIAAGITGVLSVWQLSTGISKLA